MVQNFMTIKVSWKLLVVYQAGAIAMKNNIWLKVYLWHLRLHFFTLQEQVTYEWKSLVF